jgi:predicted RND superfamily exporter protein
VSKGFKKGSFKHFDFSRPFLFLARHYKMMLAFIGLLILLSIAGIYGFISENKANSNVLDYITGNHDTRKGLDFLKEHFNVSGDAMFAVEGKTTDDTELAQKIDTISNFSAVEQLVWYGTLEVFDMIDSLLSIFTDIEIDTAEFKDFLKQPVSDENSVYLVLILHSYTPGSTAAFDLLDSISDELSPRDVSFAGMTATAKTVMHDTLDELPMYMLIAALAVILVLLMTSRSLFETLPFIIILLLSIAITIGANYLLPQVSVVAVATTALIQLAYTLAVMLMLIAHYRDKRDQYDSPIPAIKSTITAKYPTIILTSLFSMIAILSISLMPMGFDITFSLIRGIFITTIVILFFTPPILMALDKITLKKKFVRHFELTPKLAYKVYSKPEYKRSLLLILTLLGIFSILLNQSDDSIYLSYFKMSNVTNEKTNIELGSDKLANQLIIAVPVIPEDNMTQADYITELKNLEHVNSVLGAFTAIDIAPEKVIALIPLMPGDIENFFAKANDTWYTMCTIILSSNITESDSVATYTQISDITDKYFSKSFKFGVSTGIYDMSKDVHTRFLIIESIVFLVMLILFTILLKSLKKGFLVSMVLRIAMALSTSFTILFTLTNTNFLVYLLAAGILAPIVLLYTLTLFNSFESYKKSNFDQPIELAMCETLPHIMRSGIACSIGCFAVAIYASNMIVKNLTILLGAGSIMIALIISIYSAALLSIRPRKRKPPG